MRLDSRHLDPGDSRRRRDIEFARGAGRGPMWIGVPPAEQERIFSSFHRVSDDEASPAGYGLGLYFADKLVRTQGGSIRVESPIWPDADAPGARFSMRFALAEDVPDSRRPDAMVAPTAAS